jgi:hypothetical protein
MPQARALDSSLASPHSSAYGASPHLASTRTIAGDASSTRGRAARSALPARRALQYPGSRKRPCDLQPSRSAAVMVRATAAEMQQLVWAVLRYYCRADECSGTHTSAPVTLSANSPDASSASVHSWFTCDTGRVRMCPGGAKRRELYGRGSRGEDPPRFAPGASSWGRRRVLRVGAWVLLAGWNPEIREMRAAAGPCCCWVGRLPGQCTGLIAQQQDMPETPPTLGRHS